MELGRRAIYHATFRDAVSGGTVSGEILHLQLSVLTMSKGFDDTAMPSHCNCMHGLGITLHAGMC